MRYISIFTLLFSVLFFSVSCGIPIPNMSDSEQSYACLASSNNFSACCLGKGGPQTCSSGYYFRTSDKALVCNDGSVSAGCYQ